MRRGTMAIGLTAALLSAAATAGAQGPATERVEACRELIQASRITEDGRRSLQQLMRAGNSPELMDRLMHLARGLGGGDVNAGLERMIEMTEQKGRESGLISPSPTSPPR